MSTYLKEGNGEDTGGETEDGAADNVAGTSVWDGRRWGGDGAVGRSLHLSITNLTDWGTGRSLDLSVRDLGDWRASGSLNLA